MPNLFYQKRRELVMKKYKGVLCSMCQQGTTKFCKKCGCCFHLCLCESTRKAKPSRRENEKTRLRKQAYEEAP